MKNVWERLSEMVEGEVVKGPWKGDGAPEKAKPMATKKSSETFKNDVRLIMKQLSSQGEDLPKEEGTMKELVRFVDEVIDDIPEDAWHSGGGDKLYEDLVGNFEKMMTSLRGLIKLANGDV